MYTFTLGQGRVVRLQQTLDECGLQPLFADEWTASHVWPCAQHLADCLQEKGTTLAGRRLVELGSGCGLVSLVAACLGASVVATDQASVVPLLQRNASHNLQGPELARWSAVALPWGDADSLRGVLEGGRVDVVAVSDCLNPLYGLHSYKLLAETISGLCSARTEVGGCWAWVFGCLQAEGRCRY
eukprot:comp23893_c0_seq1/m.41972 comp23893_c0_seq1/g.41972  ORF comp23893_c0_seq1/g.41972 comp23893_c0_seq1/m.41972 type:complete len:185 (-) comp23893_c0_seq1:334-888(-)